MATPAPSQFAALLRQSRFASYDPSIAQVYSSFGGHAHRGNYGLKRPIPLRRRKGNVTVKSIDSTAQQTEWKSGERQTRWIQMWEEVGVTPKLVDGPWQERLGPIAETRWEADSEFGLTTRPPPKPKEPEEPVEDSSVPTEDGAEGKAKKKKKKKELKLSEAIPNIYAMTEREFERYLAKLREMRPAFLDHLDEQALEDAEENPAVSFETGSLWRHRRGVNSDKHKTFLMAQAFKEYNERDSRIIEQRPQRYGGLVYTHASMLQSKILAEAKPGRVLEQSNSRGGIGTGDFIASFAGMTPHLNKNFAEIPVVVNWRSLGASSDAPDAMRGATTFRVAKANLIAAPAVVQPGPRIMDSAKMEVEVYVPPVIEHEKQNPYPPGSAEYVGYQIVKEPSMTQKSKRPTKPGVDWSASSRSDVAGDLVQTLGTIISGKPPTDQSS